MPHGRDRHALPAFCLFMPTMTVSQSKSLPLPSFHHRHGVFDEHVKGRLLQILTRKSPRLFFRARDLISTMPQVSGTHEPAITALIDALAQGGWGDFLFDIGANIGLSSCPGGKRFKAVHMYEPNPLCANILEVNAAIALDAGQYVVHRFGLGDTDKQVPLTIPRDNWGGAFIRDEGNAYDADVLARKDGFARVESSNYFNVDIAVRNAEAEMRERFSELSVRGLRRGVIKIDVEGYEPVVLRGIARALPADVHVVIVFESWDARLKIQDILDVFGGRATASKLVEKMPWKASWPRWMKWLQLARNAPVTAVLDANEGGDWRGDVVLRVE